MGVTLKDVAKKAGVSIGTASMALNNSDKVNRETYKIVQKVARDMNYIPNARARALVKKSTSIIGLVVPHIINPFFAELAQAVKNEARKVGYNVILCSTDGKSNEEARYIEFFKSGLVDGAIFASQEKLSKETSELLEDLAENYISVVNINTQDFASELVPVVKTDLVNIGYILTKYLIQLGHRRIGFGSHSPRRFDGFRRAVNEYNLSNLEFVYFPMYDVREVVEDIVNVKDRPTAFICYNDQTAIKMIQLLVEKGIKIPEEISICGTDNINISKYYNPPLTTVNIPKVEMGQRATELLIKLIKGENLNTKKMVSNFSTELVIRKSTTTYRGEKR